MEATKVIIHGTIEVDEDTNAPETKKKRLTVYLDEHTQKKFDQMYAEQITNQTGITKSEIICKAINDLADKKGILI